MKLANGFVSNSSSSSFIISKSSLTHKQLEMIRNHRHSKLEYADQDYWYITENEDTIRGSTIMDNFDMLYYLENVVKADMKKIEWSDDYD